MDDNEDNRVMSGKDSIGETSKISIRMNTNEESGIIGTNDHSIALHLSQF